MSLEIASPGSSTERHASGPAECALPPPREAADRAPGGGARATRLIQLDVLRGLAILIVLGHHYGLSDQRQTAFSWYQAGPLQGPAHWFVRFGWSGVDLFFVLSGFLVGGLLLAERRKTGQIDVPRFLARRAFKIWPGYFVYLAFVALMMGPDELGGRTRWETFRPSLLHLQNYFGSLPHRGHTWSLAVEEHFYLALPLALSALVALSGRGSARLRGLPAVALAIMVACPLLRGMVYLAEPSPPWFDVFPPTHLRADALVFGVLLAHLHGSSRAFRDWATRRAGWLAGAGLALLIPMMFIEQTGPWGGTLGLTEVYLGYGALLLAAVATPTDRGFGRVIFGNRAARSVAFIGAASYSIYLWHNDLALLPALSLSGLTASLPASVQWAGWACVYMVLAAAGGILMYHIVERPMLLLRERLAPAGRAPRYRPQGDAR